MGKDGVKKWTEVSVQMLNKAFPGESRDFRTWKTCSLLLPHALAALSDAETLELDADATANLLNNVACYLYGRADFRQAVLLFKRTLAISEAALGPDHPNVASHLNNLVGVLKELGDLAGAKAYIERALRILRESLGEDHPNTVTVRNNLAFLGSP
jgi:tetratricopeptide (TPR) repeat protein